MLRAWKHAPVGEFDEKREVFVRNAIREACWRDDQLVAINDNPLLKAWIASDRAKAIRSMFAGYPHEDRVRARHAREDSSPDRLGDFTVLKRFDASTGEKGVMLVTYNDGITHISALYDLIQLAREYVLVLEPSTWGYMDEIFLSYLGHDLDVVVQAQNPVDFGWIKSLESNLTPVTLGAGDWIWPDPFPTEFNKPPTWDIAMVSAWDALKRHDLLFKTVRDIREATGRKLTMALIGYPLSWKQEDVVAQAKRLGVEDQCTFFNHVPADVVIDVYERSKLSVLLSKREGANRAIYESWFANCPTIVYRHHRGVNIAQVVASGGVLADDHELGAALLDLLDRGEPVHPAAWARKHTGAHVATQALDGVLRSLANARGLPYTTSIVSHHPRGYLTKEDRLAMDPEYERLARYLLPA